MKLACLFSLIYRCANFTLQNLPGRSFCLLGLGFFKSDSAPCALESDSACWVLSVG